MSLSLSTSILSLATLALLAAVFLPRRSKLKVERIGIDPGFLGLNLQAAKKEFVADGHHFVKKGYLKVKDGTFLVQTQDMERLVISPNYLPELRMLPESKLSHAAALVDKHLSKFSGVDIILQNREHSDVCRLQLTQQLPQFLPEMATELDLSMSKFLVACNTKDYIPIPTYGFVYSMVLAISSRVFVGLPLAHSKEWLDSINDYLAEVVRTGNALRPYPRPLRSLLRPFLAPKHRMDTILSKALKFLSPAIEERQSANHKQTDLLGFLVEAAEVVDPISIVLKLLVLASAALHTSTMVAVGTLYDLCERPEYIESLRTEAQAALKEDGDAWQFSTIKKLRKLDSFMKESMRYNQPDALGFNRIVMSPIKLSNGLNIPTGTFINMAAESMTRDPTYYDNPDEFNGYRFFQPLQTSLDPLQKFSGIEQGNLAWGSGRLTCPGRWFASAMNKLIIGELLVRYEIKFPQGQTRRPGNLYSNGGAMPDPTQVLCLRRLE